MRALFYMAHPYSAPTPEGEAANFKMANEYAAELIELGFEVYSPISHTHPIHMEIAQDYERWMDLDKQYLYRCDALILCPGWENSSGCKVEKEWFEEHGKPVYQYGESFEGLSGVICRFCANFCSNDNLFTNPGSKEIICKCGAVYEWTENGWRMKVKGRHLAWVNDKTVAQEINKVIYQRLSEIVGEKTDILTMVDKTREMIEHEKHDHEKTKAHLRSIKNKQETESKALDKALVKIEKLRAYRDRLKRDHYITARGSINKIRTQEIHELRDAILHEFATFNDLATEHAMKANYFDKIGRSIAYFGPYVYSDSANDKVLKWVVMQYEESKYWEDLVNSEEVKEFEKLHPGAPKWRVETADIDKFEEEHPELKQYHRVKVDCANCLHDFDPVTSGEDLPHECHCCIHDFEPDPTNIEPPRGLVLEDREAEKGVEKIKLGTKDFDDLMDKLRQQIEEDEKNFVPIEMPPEIKERVEMLGGPARDRRQCEECDGSGIVTKTSLFGEYLDTCYLCNGHGGVPDHRMYSYKTGTAPTPGGIFVNAKGTKFHFSPWDKREGSFFTYCPECGEPMRPVSFQLGIICDSCKRVVH